MGNFKLITSRSKSETENQEFKVQKFTDDNYKVERYFSIEYTMLEFDIIKEIENGEDFRTKNIDSTFTPCKVGEVNGVKYLTSKANSSKDDNIVNLPKY